MLHALYKVLFEMEMFYDNNVKGFTVAFDQFNASLLNKIHFFKQILLIPNLWMYIFKINI